MFMSIGDFPESSSHAMLAGTMLIGRLCVSLRIPPRAQNKPPALNCSVICPGLFSLLRHWQGQGDDTINNTSITNNDIYMLILIIIMYDSYS